jgi:anti-sigma regulatory factor (Ser/Thr protein kinase)
MLATRATPPTGDSRSFDRRIDALADIVAHTSAVFARRGFDRTLLPAVEFAIEELFTNAVKYGSGSASPVTIDIAGIADGVQVTLIDPDVPPFDVTRAPDADLTLPIEQRTPGGLGLHLTRRLVEGLEYSYSPERRESRIMFRKTTAGARPAANKTGEDDADDRIGG